MSTPADTLHDVNDPLTANAGEAGTWGNPTGPDAMQQPAHLPLEGFDYSAGMFVGTPGQEADAIPVPLAPHVVAKLQTDVPPSYQTPHEATHRRYDAPFPVAVNQAAAGFTLIAPPKMGLHYLKVLACFITLDAAGTLKFVQGSQDGLNLGDISGAMNAGGASAPPIQLAPADVSTPWFFTSPDQGLGIVTTG
jgi:hypothetical protein